MNYDDLICLQVNCAAILEGWRNTTKDLGVAKTLYQWLNDLLIFMNQTILTFTIPCWKAGKPPPPSQTPQSMEREPPHTFGNLHFDEPSNIYRHRKYRQVYISFRPEDPRMYCFIRLLVVPQLRVQSFCRWNLSVCCRTCLLCGSVVWPNSQWGNANPGALFDELFYHGACWATALKGFSIIAGDLNVDKGEASEIRVARHGCCPG